MENTAVRARQMIGLLDLTDLSTECTPEQVAELCRRATGRHGAVAAVCVWPAFVAQASQLLAGSGVHVATVVDFPSGEEPVDEVVAMVHRSLVDGADEIDVVMPYRALMRGDETTVVELLMAVRGAVGSPARLKVIVESGELGDAELIRRATRLAIECGADFVKTSTGKTAVSATIEAVVVMLEEITTASRSGARVGIKPSGGIRTFDDAETYLSAAERMLGPGAVDADTFRFGASALLDRLEEIVDAARSTAPGSDPQG